MMKTTRTLVLCALAVATLSGCVAKQPLCETRTKIGLIEQVETQQRQIEALETDVEELWWRSEQARIETLLWELEQLREMDQQERLEVMEQRIAEIVGR